MDPINEAYNKSIAAKAATDENLNEGVSSEMDKVQMALESMIKLARGNVKQAASAFADAIENAFVDGEDNEGKYDEFVKELKKQL